VGSDRPIVGTGVMGVAASVLQPAGRATLAAGRDSPPRPALTARRGPAVTGSHIPVPA